jgi:membrane fusion protein, multidrug efflux system
VVTVRIDAYPGQTFAGKVTAIDPRVDRATRNVQVRATLDNTERKLLPGMFVTIEAATGKPEQHVTLPQTAIIYNSYGNLVYIVERQANDTLTVRQTFVTLGATRGDQVAVLDGVNPGQTVVTSGQIKLRNGVPVVINNEVQPTNEPRPQALAP